MKLSAWLLTLLILSSAQQVASAYYDPGVQRWITRDPIHEKGGVNLYCFVGNEPIWQLDRHGHGPIYVPPMPPLGDPGAVAAACKCASMIQDSMWAAHAWADQNFGIPGQMHQDSGSVADMLTHCVGACEVAKGEGACKGSGIDPRKYLQDRERGGVNPDDRLDMENNKVGFGIADSGKDCKSGCLEALWQGRLWTLVGGKPGRYKPPPPSPPALLSR